MWEPGLPARRARRGVEERVAGGRGTYREKKDGHMGARCALRGGGYVRRRATGGGEKRETG